MRAMYHSSAMLNFIATNMFVRRWKKLLLIIITMRKQQNSLLKDLNEFGYALNHRWKDFNDKANLEVKQKVSKDFYNLMETKIKTNLK